MNLENKLNQEIKKAMKSKDKDRLNAIRSIKSAIANYTTQKNAKELDDSIILGIIQKIQKQLKDSIDIYKEQNRKDLLKEDSNLLSVIEEFLPAQLSDHELTTIVLDVINSLGATTMKDMGKVMSMVNKEVNGGSDSKTISLKVKEFLK